MSNTSPTPAQLATLTDAVTHPDGSIVLPNRHKGAAAKKITAALIGFGLIEATNETGTSYRLTAAGYRAAGAEPPRSGRKNDLVRELLGRPEGADIDELMTATGWLAHTTRAALSRLRSGGTALLKSKGEDGRSRYRIETDAPSRSAKGRAKAAEEAAA